MSACICRQSGSLTLGNVKCAVNLNSVLTKCSRDPVNSPLGRVCMWQALWQVRTSYPREGEGWDAYLQPPFLSGAFLQEKGCCYSKEPSCQSCRSLERSLLVFLPHKSEEGPPCHWHCCWNQGHRLSWLYGEPDQGLTRSSYNLVNKSYIKLGSRQWGKRASSYQ